MSVLVQEEIALGQFCEIVLSQFREIALGRFRNLPTQGPFRAGVGNARHRPQTAAWAKINPRLSQKMGYSLSLPMLPGLWGIVAFPLSPDLEIKREIHFSSIVINRFMKFIGCASYRVTKARLCLFPSKEHAEDQGSTNLVTVRLIGRNLVTVLL